MMRLENKKHIDKFKMHGCYYGYEDEERRSGEIVVSVTYIYPKMIEVLLHGTRYRKKVYTDALRKCQFIKMGKAYIYAWNVTKRDELK